MRPYYERAVAAKPVDARAGMFWRWDGGLGFDVSPNYPQDATAGDSEEDGEANCYIARRHMGGHFYLTKMDCNVVPNWKYDRP